MWLTTLPWPWEWRRQSRLTWSSSSCRESPSEKTSPWWLSSSSRLPLPDRSGPDCRKAEAQSMIQRFSFKTCFDVWKMMKFELKLKTSWTWVKFRHIRPCNRPVWECHRWLPSSKCCWGCEWSCLYCRPACTSASTNSFLAIMPIALVRLDL